MLMHLFLIIHNFLAAVKDHIWYHTVVVDNRGQLWSIGTKKIQN